MLLMEFPINGVTQYVSYKKVCRLTHSWKPYIKSFTPPSWRMATQHGGMRRFGGGSFTLSARLFRDLGVWPPPALANTTAKNTETTEEAAVELFSSTVYLVSYNNTDVKYDIREPEYPQMLLDQAIDYDGNDVDLPRAIGPVTHVTLVRLENDGAGRPRYHLGGAQVGTTAIEIIGFSSASGGAATRVITDGAHGFSNDDTVYIVGSDNFDDGHVASDASGSSFVIPVAFAQETLPISAQCYKAGAISIHDDGVPIPAIFNGDNTVSLTADPVGLVTMIATGAQTTLSELADWCTTRLEISTFTDTNGRDPSPELSRWETSQQTVVDFLDKACQSSTHLFDIKNDELTLVCLFKDNGSRTLTNHQFRRRAEYGKPNPVKKLVCEWQTQYHKVGWVNDDGSGGQSHFIATEDHKIEEPLHPDGQEKTIDVFHTREAQVRSALICIRSIYERDRATIAINMDAGMPASGENFSWEDITLPVDVPGFVRVRDVDLDFSKNKIVISGEGLFIQTDRMSDPGSGAVSGAATETIDSFDMTLGHGAVWWYTLTDAARTNRRAGVIQACWDQAAGGQVTMMPDEHGPDTGTTLGVVSFTVDKAATTIRFRAASLSGTWNVYRVRRILGATY